MTCSVLRILFTCHPILLQHPIRDRIYWKKCQHSQYLTRFHIQKIRRPRQVGIMRAWNLKNVIRWHYCSRAQKTDMKNSSAVECYRRLNIVFAFFPGSDLPPLILSVNKKALFLIMFFNQCSVSRITVTHSSLFQK